MKYLTTALLAGLIASVSYGGEFQLSYNDNSDNETGFGLEVAIDGGEFERVLTVGANVSEMKYVASESATRETLFAFRVYAFNDYGESGYTNTVETTIKDSSAPADPDGLLRVQYVDTVTINAQQVIINPAE